MKLFRYTPDVYKRQVCPLSLRRLPSISIPTSDAASGRRSETITVTIIGKSIGGMD